MDGISRTAGVGPTIELGGRKLTVNARILRHYAEIEAEIIKRRGNPFDLIRDAKEALKDCPDIMRTFVAHAFEEARKFKEVSLVEMGEWLNDTWAGQCMTVWLSVRDNDRQTLTLDRVTEMFTDEFEERIRKHGQEAASIWRTEIENAINQAGGEDELGNSNGSPQSRSEPETAEEASPGTASS